MSRLLERARDLLTRPHAWLSAESDGAYALRLSADRRSRVSLTLHEAEFRALVERPGLRARPGGGWTGRVEPSAVAASPPGRPGVVMGERDLIQDDGRLVRRTANLGESPIAWLARRKDVSGRPWLTPAEAAAGERLRREAEFAHKGPSLTMRWDALPTAGSGTATRLEPSDRALSAGRRVEQALSAVGPRLRPMLTRICIHGDSLKLAETGLGLRRRQGKTVLKQALQALAEHYGIG